MQRASRLTLQLVVAVVRFFVQGVLLFLDWLFNVSNNTKSIIVDGVTAALFFVRCFKKLAVLKNTANNSALSVNDLALSTTVFIPTLCLCLRRFAELCLGKTVRLVTSQQSF